MNRAIFKKEFRNINSQIEKMKELEKRTDVDKTTLKNDIKMLIKGDCGESKVAFHLRNICLPIFCFHNIKLKNGKDCFQCDFVVVSKKAIYVIENKDWNGNIKFLENGTVIRNTVKGEETMGNPYAQNKRHSDNLKYILVKNNIVPEYIDFKPIVVMSDKYTIIRFEDTNTDIKKAILYVEDISIYLAKELNSSDEDILTDEDIDKISNYLIANNIEETLRPFNEDKYILLEPKIKKQKLDKPVNSKKEYNVQDRFKKKHTKKRSCGNNKRR